MTGDRLRARTCTSTSVSGGVSGPTSTTLDCAVTTVGMPVALRWMEFSLSLTRSVPVIRTQYSTDALSQLRSIWLLKLNCSPGCALKLNDPMTLATLESKAKPLHGGWGSHRVRLVK